MSYRLRPIDPLMLELCNSRRGVQSSVAPVVHSASPPAPAPVAQPAPAPVSAPTPPAPAQPQQPAALPPGFSLRQIAFHEAGHIVVAEALGMKWDYVTCGPHHPRCPEMLIAHASIFEHNHSAFDSATVDFAGAEAHRLIEPFADTLNTLASIDTRKARKKLESCDPDYDTEMRARARARYLLEQNWPKVCSLAAALMEHGRVEAAA